MVRNSQVAMGPGNCPHSCVGLHWHSRLVIMKSGQLLIADTVSVSFLKPCLCQLISTRLFLIIPLQ